MPRLCQPYYTKPDRFVIFPCNDVFVLPQAGAIRLHRILIDMTLVIAMLFFAQNDLLSQSIVVKYPVRPGYYPNYYVSVNPAFAGTQSAREAYMGNQRLLANFTDIATYFFKQVIKRNSFFYSNWTS